jgi:hypothetical protein
MEPLDWMEQLVQVVFKVRLEQLVQVDLKVLLDHKDHKDHKDRQVQVA